MIDNTSASESVEAFPIPEGAILLESDDGSTFRELAISALKKILKERNLTLPLGPELDLNKAERLISLNRFAIQLVTSGVTADEISVPLGHWYLKGASPQILLAAMIDDENNVVSFPGILTGSELEELISDRLKEQDSIFISINDFKGGVERLLSFVRLLEPEAIPRQGLASEFQSKWSWGPVVKNIKPTLSIAAFAAVGMILGPEILKPNLIGNIATLSEDSIKLSSYTRGFEQANPIKACLISPSLVTSEASSNAVADISIDKPLIFPLDSLNQITISSNGNTLWSQSATSSKRIKGPLKWPIEPIKAGQELVITIRPNQTYFGGEAKIILQATPTDRFQKLDSIVNSLGGKKSQWIKAINQNLDKDRTLALTLLFSDKAPKSKVLDQARSIILSKKGCLKN